MKQNSSRPRIAVITTAYYPYAHADVMVTRWLDPLPGDAAFGWPANGAKQPRTAIASMYIAQYPENDMGREISARYGVPIFETIHDALTLGGDTLAVDGVLLIGEHGVYPDNEWGQKMYPRRELFDEIVAVFRECGRTAPVFNDKHFSYDADSARHIVAVAKELNFPLMAGSSIPLCGYIEPHGVTSGTPLKEGLELFYDGIEAYGYHTIEQLQSIIGMRAGGESGIESVVAYRGEDFWKLEGSNEWPRDLVEAALACSINVQAADYREALREPSKPHYLDYQRPIAWQFQHRDGFRTSYLSLNGYMADFSLAVRNQAGGARGACSTSSNNWRNNFFAHFAQLDAHVEEFFVTRIPPFPVEHYLLATLATDAAVRALATPGEVIATPGLEIAYQL